MAIKTSRLTTTSVLSEALQWYAPLASWLVVLTVRVESVLVLAIENVELPSVGRGEAEPSRCHVMVLFSEFVPQDRKNDVAALTLKRDDGKSVTLGDDVDAPISDRVS